MMAMSFSSSALALIQNFLNEAKEVHKGPLFYPDKQDFLCATREKVDGLHIKVHFLLLFL